MTEHHAIAGPARGEPLARPRSGACVRLPLDSAPTPRWTRAFTAQLVTRLTGHAAVGHLRLKDVVQGSDIVLEGVEPPEAAQLGPAVRAAIAAANEACDQPDPDTPPPGNMAQAEADRLAQTVNASVME